jgi:hypothetical protein
MKNLRLFAQISKIDEARREVTGVATSEVVDKDGEVFDYETSKPYFKSWSAEISKATDGNSLGNVREMHEPSAVGKLTAINFDDQQKEIVVIAKIVDDPAWNKCLEGVYTGFSIGGQYVKTWKDGEIIRYTAKPAEVSIVDNPCNPSAHFTSVKLDGGLEIRKFRRFSSMDDQKERIVASLVRAANSCPLYTSEISLVGQNVTKLLAGYSGELDDQLIVPVELAAKQGDAAGVAKALRPLVMLLKTPREAGSFSAEYQASLARPIKIIGSEDPAVGNFQQTQRVVKPATPARVAKRKDDRRACVEAIKAQSPVAAWLIGDAQQLNKNSK